MCHFSTSLLFNFHLKAVPFAYISVLVFVKNKPYTDDVIKSENKRTTVDCGLNSDKGGHLPEQVARNGMFHNQDFMITKLQLNIPIPRLANGNTGKDKSLCCTIGTTGKGEFFQWQTNMANADGACLPRERRTTRRSVRTRCTNMAQKKASNSRIMRQGFDPDTCKHNRITQVCTSTKRLSEKVNPNPRQEQSLVLSGRKNKEEISNG